MHYDVVIIGAGLSGLAAGIRLAYFDKKVCVLERHEVYGGLSSFYTLGGRSFDVGLHALTNYAPPEARSAPLSKLFRQLRLDRTEFELCPQRHSEIRFPGCTLRFTNDLAVLMQEVAEKFPRAVDGFRRFVAAMRSYDDLRFDVPWRSVREVLGAALSDRRLVEMLLCPVMYYGSAEEHDMDFTSFVTLFKSIFCEGLARPRTGIRAILRALVKKYRACGGKLRTKCGVERLITDGTRVTELELQSGERVTADTVLSSAGYFETLQLCSDTREPPPQEEVGKLSFFESIAITDVPPAQLGLDAAIIFFNDSPTFTYAKPEALVDVRSGVVCCPNNFERHEDLPEGTVRLTVLADFERWSGLDEKTYVRAKRECYDQIITHAVGLGAVPDFRERVIYTDTFTPRTIRKYTGRINGAVYGAPRKIRDGRTRYKNLFICGTDQGFLGIIGAMLSGISMANLHVLSNEL
ncbi:MAG: NAD(P)/FAD-dependent oxidoreductase [Planctomycetota bacterium]